jgi:GPI-anchor transamidase subunit S
MGYLGRPSAANSFLLPQWGGIYIHNLNSLPEHLGFVSLSNSELHPAFSTFSRQLLTLLGVPQLPTGIHAGKNALTRWQLDALLRRRAKENVENSQDTLSSIIKLVDQIENMPVGRNVRDTVQDSLSALEQVWCQQHPIYKGFIWFNCFQFQTFALAGHSAKQALQYSSQALTLASKAFFDPSMLALLYFPAEHKAAVYSPLFASGLLPLVLTAIKELKAWKQERRRATTPWAVLNLIDRCVNYYTDNSWHV